MPRRSKGKAKPVGAWALAIAQKHGLSQTAFGKLIGVGRMAVTKWSTGASQPERDTIDRIREAFPNEPPPPQARTSEGQASVSSGMSPNGHKPGGRGVSIQEDWQIVVDDIVAIKKGSPLRRRAIREALNAIAKAVEDPTESVAGSSRD